MPTRAIGDLVAGKLGAASPIDAAVPTCSKPRRPRHADHSRLVGDHAESTRAIGNTVGDLVAGKLAGGSPDRRAAHIVSEAVGLWRPARVAPRSSALGTLTTGWRTRSRPPTPGG